MVNKGTIRASEGGYVALIGPQVANEGVIAARLGTAALGAGDQVTLQLEGNSLVGFSVDKAALDALATNKQLIQADGGAVILSAKAKDALLNTVVNNEGVVEARSVSVKNGVIRLEGGASGVVSVSGKLDASGANVGEAGGAITVTGDKVGLMDGAVVDASGHSGGGSVLVGGDYQGRNAAVQNTSRTFVAPMAAMMADAVDKGDGGKVIVWSDDSTRFFGSISAKGGAHGGDGGFVETSGKVVLESTGAVDASAASGRAGSWLLDPNNITIQTAGANTNVTASPNFTTTNDNAIVTTGSIVTALNAGTSVTVTTASAGANTQAGNITVANAIGKTAGANATLTLNATNNIAFNAGANLTSTANQLNVTLNAGGSITNPANVNTNGGALTFNAAGASTQSGVISGAGSVVKNGVGTLALSGTNTYTGATSINAGVVQAQSNGALGGTGTGTTVATGAALEISGTGLAIAEPLTLTGSGVSNGGALRNLANANTMTGAITLGAGGARINSDAGVLTLSGAGNITGATQPLTVGGAGDTTISKVIATTSGTLTKDGAGTLTLSGNNSFTGATLINAGVVRAQSNTALGTAAGGVTVTSGAALELSGGITVGAEALSLNGTGVTNNGALRNVIGTNTWGGTVTLAGAAEIQSDAGTLTLNAANAVTGANQNLTFDGAGNGVISGTITTGSGTLTKNGAGTLTLSGAGANTYSGATNVNAGTLQVSKASALGSTAAGTIVLAGATLNINNVNIGTEALTLNGSGVGAVGALTGTGAGAIANGPVTLASDTTLGAGAGATLTVGGVVSESGGVRTLTKTGAGTLTLSGANTYTGGTTVNAGTLVLAGGSAIADTGAVNLSTAGANLTLNASETIGSVAGVTGTTVTLGANTLTTGGNNGTTTFAGVVSGTGGLAKQGTGTLTLGGANLHTGLTTVSAGTLAYGVSNALASGAVTVSGGTLDLSTFSDAVGAVTLISGGITGTSGVLTGTSYAVQSGAISASLAGAGVALTKSTAGTVMLSGANTYSGATTVNAGTLQVAGGAAIANTSAVALANVAGAILDLNGSSETIGNLSGGGATGGNVTLGAGTLTVNQAAATTFSGVISGSGGLTKIGAGTLTLSGANAYTGVTTVNVGTLSLGANNVLADTSTVLVNGGTFAIGTSSDTVAGTQLVSGSITGTSGVLTSTSAFDVRSGTASAILGGAVGLNKTTGGTVTLSGANTYTGTTTVNAGTLALSGGAAIANTAAVNLDTSGANLTLNASETIGSLAGVAGTTVTLGANTLTSGDATNTTYAGVISGAGSVVKNGVGTLALSGTNTYTGATSINAGVVQAQSNGALGGTGTGTTVATGAALEISGTGLAIAEPLTLTGSGVSNGGALRNLANANTMTGAITLGAGGARINSDAGVLTLSGAGNITGATQPLTVGGAGDTTISKVIATTSGTLTKDGAGTLTLSGNNSFTGATLINAGVVRAQSNTALGTAAGGVTVTSGAALELSGGITVGAEALSLNGTGVTNNGALRNVIGTNTWGGTVTLAGAAEIQSDAGTLTLNAANAVTGANQNLTFDGAGNGVISGTITTGSGTLTKNGAGTLTLSAANTYSGATTINAGTLLASNAAALGPGSSTTVNSGATLELDGTLTYAEPVALNSATLTWVVGNPTLNGAVALTGTNTITGAAGTFTLGGVISGAGGFDKTGAGTVVVSGNNTYSGVTQVSAGTLQVSGSNGLGSTAGGTNIGGNARLTLNGVAVGAEPVTLNGPGLFGTGAITSNGVASLAGPITLAADSVIAPNAASTLTLAGPIDGAFGLTTGGSGTLNLNGNVGGTSALAFLTTGATGATGINAGLVRTSGNQSYNNPTTIGAGATLQSTGGNLVAANPVTATAGTLSLSAAGTVSFNDAANNFNTVGVTAGGNATLRDANAIVLAASSIGGDLALSSNGAVTQTGAISVVGASTVNAGPGPITLTGTNDFGGNVALTTTGTARVNDVNGLAFGASNVGTLTATAGAGLTLNGNVVATGGGTSIVLAGTTFTNNAGVTALNPGAGRWLVYSTDPTLNSFGGLASGNQALWNRTYPAAVPETGNRYVFATQPTLTFTSTNVAKIYGQDATATVAGAYGVAGFVSAATYGGVFTQDTVANAVSGTPAVTSLGSPGTAPVAGSPYAINVDVSGVTTTTGYAKAAASSGQITVNAAPLTIAADDKAKVYGDADPVLTATYTGLQNGETPAVVTGLALSAPTGAAASVIGSPHTIAASGASSPNYTILYIDGQLIVTPRPIAVAANAQTKVYGDAEPVLTYVVGGGGLVYGDTLAGSLTRVAGETVAGSPYSILQGTVTNAANPNYAISYTGNVLTITPATLVGGIMAANKVYDANTSATITSRTLAGVVGSDAVSYVGGAASFADKNVGTGKTVTATGLALVGADAGNYTVNTTATTIANITPAPLTIAATTNMKTYDGTRSATAIPAVAGLQPGDTVTGLAQIYDSKNAGTGKTLSVSAYTVNDGNSGGNYSVNTFDNTTGVIDPAALTYVANPAFGPSGHAVSALHGNCRRIRRW